MDILKFFVRVWTGELAILRCGLTVGWLGGSIAIGCVSAVNACLTIAYYRTKDVHTRKWLLGTITVLVCYTSYRIVPGVYTKLCNVCGWASNLSGVHITIEFMQNSLYWIFPIIGVAWCYFTVRFGRKKPLELT